MGSKAKIVDKDTGFDAFFNRLDLLNGTVIKVGIQAKQGAQIRSAGRTVADIGNIHEFGAPRANIPERSFLRATMDENIQKHERLVKKAIEDVTKGRNPDAVLFQVAQSVRNDVIEKIDSNIPPPLAASTVKRKGDDLALVDTGIMRNAISGVVERK